LHCGPIRARHAAVDDRRWLRSSDHMPNQVNDKDPPSITHGALWRHCGVRSDEPGLETLRVGSGLKVAVDMTICNV
jgi:hypothetical protein